MPRGQWPGNKQAALAWSQGKNRNRAKLRREMPSRLVSRLRAVATKLALTVLEYEHETGPASRPFWVDLWIRLPDGREAGVDTTWDSGAPIAPLDRQRQIAKEEWLAQAGVPYLFFDKKRSSIEMELDLRRWLRRITSAGPTP